jgi:hypothetical protein
MNLQSLLIALIALLVFVHFFINKNKNEDEEDEEDEDDITISDDTISDDTIRLEAYYIAEKDGFKKSPDEYWQMALESLTKH